MKDWAWRLKKLRPDTDVDVEDTNFFYNYVPVKAVPGTSDNWGTFEHHGDNGVINIWSDMIPDSQYGGIHSKDSRLSRTISHETNHNYVHNLLEDNHTKQEEDLLMQAYPNEIFNSPENPINERRATNMELRKQISQWDNNSTMEDLDKAIDRIHPTQLMDMYFRTSGYTQDPTKQNRKYMQLPNGNWDRKKIDLMKRALKDVAQNSYGNTPLYNIAALGGPLIEAVRKFAGGGSKGEEEEVNTIVPFTQKTEVVITPDTEYNQYLNTLPDNQRFTPNDAYDSYLYWKLNSRPKNFSEAVSKGMFTYDHSDNAYHANSIAFGEDGVGYFMKPKTHNTVGFETDWYNKGLVTEEGGTQRPMTPEERAEWLNFRSQYNLIDDPDRPNYYRYEPKNKPSIGGNLYGGGGGLMPIINVPVVLKNAYNAARSRLYRTITP